MSSISSQSALESWTANNIGTLIQDITLDGGSWPMVLNDGAIFDGGGYTITLADNVAQRSGIFSFSANSTVQVKNQD